ncbi:MAG TPA: signal peptidase I [Chthonomonadaceae bacterium]|nr:signal peptidase I [Chthonomonadaceae bacterium]
MNPNETGAAELLANLHIETVVLIAVALTVLRMILLHIKTQARRGVPAEVHPYARAVAEIIESLIVAGVLVFLIIRPFFVQAFFIPSESMEPTLCGHDAGVNQRGIMHDDTCHDHIFVNKLVYRYSQPHRDDIIVFKAPKSADAEDKIQGKPQVENVLIKRLIGLPGDTVQIKPDGVYVNDQKLNEPYIKEAMDPSLEPNFKYGADGKPVHLGPNQLWVMGDNRNDSNDSRYWGPLDRSRVIGKASLIFWPLNRVRVLH